MKRGKVARAAAAVAVVLLGLQLVPVSRTNPPVTEDLAAPVEISAPLRRACYDCHSNETRWPWYAYVAPVSLLVTKDVVKGRKHLNFSEWDAVAPDKRVRKLRKAGRMIEEGTMPLGIYTPLHPDARLSAAEKSTLVGWLRGGRGGGRGERGQPREEP